MSEADRTWRVTAGEKEHEIEVEHSAMTGKIVVKLDGQAVADTRLWFSRKEIPVTVESHTALVSVSSAYGGFGAKSKLHLDGRYVEPLSG